MRKKLIAANWKMNKTIKEALMFAESFEAESLSKDVDVTIFAPFMTLPALAEAFEESHVALGAQNMYHEDSGAFTGEVSPVMIQEVCSHVLIGHSDRREFFSESNETLNKKIKKALEHGFSVVYCVGELHEDRQNGKTEQVLNNQVTEGLKDISAEQMKHITLAYEPVWAISRGDSSVKPATTEDAEKAHAFIRSLVAELFSDAVANEVRILYGGSMKPDNAKELLAQENIDGGLVGGASLDAESFRKICECSLT